MNKIMENIKITADLPHLRRGEWNSKNNASQKITEEYLETLVGLGMSEGDAQCLVSDLYWACYDELEANGLISGSCNDEKK